jgi:drug/metabolite transporter (DMT)-like permease
MPRTTDTGFFGSLRFRYGLGLAAFLAVALYLLWEEHEAHIAGYLPLALVLGVCVGMHFFMHGGHGGGHGSHDDTPREDDN